MKLRKILTTAALTLTALTAQASMDKVIYGDDNRLDIFEVTNAMHQRLAKSTAALVKSYNVEETRSGMKLSGGSLNVCDGERFKGQQTAAFCSGFLVEKDSKQFFVTAGHCIRTQSACESTKYVFDYKVNEAGQREHIVPSSSVYSCKRLVAQELNSMDKNDYAVIELDREVTDREPLTFRQNGTISTGEEILVIGHPSGLPTKVADDAFVRDTNSIFFETNLDTYGGNSGSAVFNATSGEVEGILVRGHNDYEYRNGCKASVRCDMDSCRGEDVTNIRAIPFLR
jgi:V8-like Glu-specific endopeptidase